MAHKKIRRNLINLSVGELVSTIMFMFVFNYTLKYSLRLSIDIVLIYPFTILEFILLQGSYYWFYRIRKIDGKIVNESIFKRLYRILRLVDLILILIYPIIVIYLFLFDRTIRILRFESFLGSFIFLFSVVEYINYFYIRLSYSNTDDILALIKLKNLKKSSISKELDLLEFD